MGAPEGNQFWKLRSKHGRNKIFEKPEILEQACTEYFEITSKRTLNEQNWVGKNGDEVIKHHNVPFTITGLCIFLGINFETWRNYKNNEDYKDFNEVITRVENIIYTQKFEGAATGFFNHNIIARDLGLADKKDLNIDANKKTIDELFPKDNECQE
jgi:hypothetical protein